MLDLLITTVLVVVLGICIIVLTRQQKAENARRRGGQNSSQGFGLRKRNLGRQNTTQDVGLPNTNLGRQNTSQDVGLPNTNLGRQDTSQDVGLPNTNLGRQDTSQDVGLPNTNLGRQDTSQDVGLPNTNLGRQDTSRDVGLPNTNLGIQNTSQDVGLPNTNLESSYAKIKPTEERRIILLGKTGNGKSATGNSILGRKAFKSEMSSVSVTQRCKRESATRLNMKLNVIDTPGLYDTERDFIDVALAIFLCIHLSQPGPHAFIIVLDKTRFTKEENESVTLLRAIFGDNFLKHAIVLFTHKDEMKRQGVELKSMINKNTNLSLLIQSCQNRYIAFNNFANEKENEKQLNRLLGIINKMTNSGRNICETEASKIHERVLKEKCYMFENLADTLQLCHKYLEEVQKEIQKMDKQKRQQYITQTLINLAVGGSAAAVAGAAASPPATLAFVAGVISKFWKNA